MLRVIGSVGVQESVSRFRKTEKGWGFLFITVVCGLFFRVFVTLNQQGCISLDYHLR